MSNEKTSQEEQKKEIPEEKRDRSQETVGESCPSPDQTY